jgi:tetratricopeptide (TPR) repeat protein
VQGDLNGAQSTLKELEKEYPRAATVRTQMGIVAAARKDPAGARREFQQALALDPGSIDALGGTIAIDIQEKNTSEATARVAERLKKAPNDPDALLLAATTYAAVGDAQQEEEMLRRTLTVDPGNIRALVSLGTLHARQNKLDQAKTEFEAVARRVPSMTGVQTVVAAILHAQRKPQEAKQLYEKVLAADPNAALAANNLAWLYAERGENLDLALQLAQSAKQKLPDLPAVNDTLGWIYYQKNQAGLAITPLELSVAKDPANATYRYHLGMAYAKVGNKPKALETLNEALRRKPDFHEAADAHKALSSQS